MAVLCGTLLIGVAALLLPTFIWPLLFLAMLLVAAYGCTVVISLARPGRRFIGPVTLFGIRLAWRVAWSGWHALAAVAHSGAFAAVRCGLLSTPWALTLADRVPPLGLVREIVLALAKAAMAKSPDTNLSIRARLRMFAALRHIPVSQDFAFWVREVFFAFMDMEQWNETIVPKYDDGWKLILLNDDAVAILQDYLAAWEAVAADGEGGADSSAEWYAFKLRLHLDFLVSIREFGEELARTRWEERIRAERAAEFVRLQPMLRDGEGDLLTSWIKPIRHRPIFKTGADYTDTVAPLIDELQQASSAPDGDGSQAQRIDLIQRAIQLVEAGEGDFALWSMLQVELGIALINTHDATRDTNLERAVTALQYAARVVAPDRMYWLRNQIALGVAYLERTHGNRGDNVERALVALRATAWVNVGGVAAHVSYQLYVFGHAALGTAYMERMYGGRADNVEQAIEHYEQALQYARPRAKHRRSGVVPPGWAGTLYNNLGTAYLARLAGQRARNIEQALEAFVQASRSRTPESAPYEWALIQFNLGLAFASRQAGDRSTNGRKAVRAFERALTIFTPAALPYEWALTQYGLGTVYAEYGERALAGLGNEPHDARELYQAAREKFSSEEFPRERRDVSWMLGVFLERNEQWEAAHEAYEEARYAQRAVMARASFSRGWLASAIENASHDLYVRDAWSLLQMGTARPDTIVEVLEEGRAQALRVEMSMDERPRGSTTDLAAQQRWQEFVAARDVWRAAQRRHVAEAPRGVYMTDTWFIPEGRRVAAERAYGVLTHTRDAIRAHDDPAFLLPKPGLSAAEQALDSNDEALVYLATTDHGGFAMLVQNDKYGATRAERVALPALSANSIGALWETHGRSAGAIDDEEQAVQEDICGGLGQAQMGWAYDTLTRWGRTPRQALGRLPADSGFAHALGEVVDRWEADATHPYLSPLLDMPFTKLEHEYTYGVYGARLMAAAFRRRLQAFEARRSLRVAATFGLEELVEELHRREVKRVYLVPCGPLGVLPWPAVAVRAGAARGAPSAAEIDAPSSESWRRLGELFEVAVVPSAAALAAAKGRAGKKGPDDARPLLLAVGNPTSDAHTPTMASLEFAEAEADTIQRLASDLGYGTAQVRVLTRDEATRDRVLPAMREAWYVHLAAHGVHHPSNPGDTKLLLAHGESLTLEQCLTREVDLEGVRLLVLSACETSSVDAQWAADEALGLASGFLQAGAASVLATLWPVDDRATYLLMSRFARLYLDPLLGWSPARCLAEAQRWLREEATNAVLRTYDPEAEVAVQVLSGAAQLPSRPAHADQAHKESVASRPEPERGELTSQVSQERSMRYSQEGALLEVEATARFADPDALPYADPVYWAAFTLSGAIA